PEFMQQWMISQLGHDTEEGFKIKSQSQLEQTFYNPSGRSKHLFLANFRQHTFRIYHKGMLIFTDDRFDSASVSSNEVVDKTARSQLTLLNTKQHIEVEMTAKCEQ